MEPDFLTRHAAGPVAFRGSFTTSLTGLQPRLTPARSAMLRRSRLNGLAVDETQPDARAVEIARQIVSELFGPPTDRNFPVRYWNGAVDQAANRHAVRYCLILRHAGALRKMFLPPTETALAEAFLHDDFDVEGDMEAAAELASVLAERLRSLSRLVRLGTLLLQLPSGTLGDTSQDVARPNNRWERWRAMVHGRRHARRRDALAIKHHYDVGNEFYALWLDEHLAYSCAYFPPKTGDLTQAQEAKFDLICRKLRLRPGEELLDIGCGWGGLIRYAARKYGVTAVGITLSEAQAGLARERIAQDGLQDRCKVTVLDYRDLPTNHLFDKVVSVGMFEHVGRAKLEEYFSVVTRLLRPGGLFLNHGIVSLDGARDPRGGAAPARRLWGKGRFIGRYVFPDGELVPLATAISAGEATGLETRDVESLREHYAETLHHWVTRLEQHSVEARAMVGEKRYRVWRLYMAASAHAFRAARIGVVQMLFARPAADGRCDHPPTRADIYAP